MAVVGYFQPTEREWGIDGGRDIRCGYPITLLQLRYVGNRIFDINWHRAAGAAMFAPMVNPYDPCMSKEERRRTWEKWSGKRKLMYYLARRVPPVLPLFYRKSFLSGKHDQIDKWLALSLGKRVRRYYQQSQLIYNCNECSSLLLDD